MPIENTRIDLLQEESHYYKSLEEYLLHNNDFSEFLFSIPPSHRPELNEMLSKHDNEFLISWIEYNDEYSV